MFSQQKNKFSLLQTSVSDPKESEREKARECMQYVRAETATRERETSTKGGAAAAMRKKQMQVYQVSIVRARLLLFVCLLHTHPLSFPHAQPSVPAFLPLISPHTTTANDSA